MGMSFLTNEREPAPAVCTARRWRSCSGWPGTDLRSGAVEVTVVVLNTRRDLPLPDGRDEPIASGPLVAKFLAERLGLVNGRDSGGGDPWRVWR
jgi:hypothetical protein